MTYLQRPWHGKNYYYSILSLQQSRDYNSTKKKCVLTCIIKGHTSLQCHYSSLLKAAGCLRGALETCSGASDLSTARPNRWPGLHRTVGFQVLSDAIWCYLWFSEADTFRYMAFPSGRTKSTFWIPAGCYTCRRRSLKTRRSAAVHSSGTAGIDFFFGADRWLWSCRRTSQQWYWRTIQQEFMGVGPPSMETLVKTVKTTFF